jgi:hypothetical protein
MTKAISYIRVSTEDQAKEGITLENQEAKIRSYCDLKDFDLIEIIDDAVSAPRISADLVLKGSSRWPRIRWSMLLLSINWIECSEAPSMH